MKQLAESGLSGKISKSLMDYLSSGKIPTPEGPPVPNIEMLRDPHAHKELIEAAVPVGEGIVSPFMKEFNAVAGSEVKALLQQALPEVKHGAHTLFDFIVHLAHEHKSKEDKHEQQKEVTPEIRERGQRKYPIYPNSEHQIRL